MKKSFLTLSKMIGILTCFIIMLLGCDDSDDSPPSPPSPSSSQTVWMTLKTTESLSMVRDEMNKDSFEELRNKLDNAEETHTFFVPSNSAITTLLGTFMINDFEALSASVVESVLKYHLVNQRIATSDLTSGESFQTLQGEDVMIIEGPKLQSGNIAPAIINQTIEATNGVIHVINTAMVPPTIAIEIRMTLGTLLQPVFLSSNFTILAEIIKSVDRDRTGDNKLFSVLTTRSSGAVTFFAPTDDSFRAFFEAKGKAISSFTDSQWQAMIRNHIVRGQGGDDGIAEDELIPSSMFTTITGRNVNITMGTPTIPGGPGIFIDINGSAPPEGEVVGFDAFSGSNGRIHLIKGVLTE